jgi:hypothetical protein
VDIATARMLGELPSNLQVRGWSLVRQDSRICEVSGPRWYRWYIAVYQRRYEPSIDDDRLVSSMHDGWIRVSTASLQSPSWVDAYTDAMQLMEEADRHRTPGGS